MTRYHRSTWPLLVPPYRSDLLTYLDRDYGTSPTSSDDEIRAALKAAGHNPDSNRYDEMVVESHQLRRYQAVTGLPF